MKVLLSLAHFLVGLLVIALTAGVAFWAWPSATSITLPIAYAAMALLAFHTIYRAVKRAPNGEPRG